MLKACEWFVDETCRKCVEFAGFCTPLFWRGLDGGKPGGLATVFARLFQRLFHSAVGVFQSVIGRVLPIINIANNNDNYIKLNINYYWRISV